MIRIKAVIVDDERSGRETLQIILNKFFGDQIEVLGSAAGLREAETLVQNSNPDLVFLDMEMPDGPGLKLLSGTKPVAFITVVTTAHRDYGIEALKAGAVDYLLKPVDPEELQVCLQKVRQLYDERKKQNLMEVLLDKVDDLKTAAGKIALLTNNNQTVFVEKKRIVRCEADGNYTVVRQLDVKPIMVTKQLGDLERMIESDRFFRIHKSHLVNLDLVKSIQKSKDEVTMEDEAVLPISRNLKAEFLKKMTGE